MFYLYIGLKIKLKQTDILCGSPKEFYLKHGYVYVQDIWDNGNILVGGDIGVGVTITRDFIEDIIPVDNILEVLWNKKRERDKIQKDIDRIEAYINWKCSKNCKIQCTFGKAI